MARRTKSALLAACTAHVIAGPGELTIREHAMSRLTEICAICGCTVHHDGDYAKPTVKGRSHATRHHCVAERFFGRSANRPGTQRTPIFPEDPWQTQGLAVTFCYECHEELIHNPVLLEDDIERFAQVCRNRGYSESRKSTDRTRIAGRIRLFQEVMARGLRELEMDDAELTASPPLCTVARESCARQRR